MSNSPTAIKVSQQLQLVASNIEYDLRRITGQKVSFSLFVWTEGRANYVSNSHERAKIKSALLSVIEGWDDGQPDVPAHEVS